MNAVSENGTVEYYLATAGVIPLLLIAYLFSMKAIDALQMMVDKHKANTHLWWVILFGALAPLITLGAAIGGEIACLRALFTGSPSNTNACWSIAGLIVMPFAGIIHVIILACIGPSNGNNGQAKNTTP
ncbi:hypothetical protein OG241_22520 [Streptomyces sp. NBC_01390]|uniref:hypothetical protein n=1 Tax=Streptomyces sp. NBC_01390 TaxID=2903850 RepID=UPI00324404CC